jgi:hypothetical protein
MREVILHPEALSEFIESGEKYTDISIPLGNAFVEQIEKNLELISKLTAAFPFLEDEDNIRKCVILRFPYTILYEEINSVIYIWAFAPQREDPDYWKDRLKD